MTDHEAMAEFIQETSYPSKTGNSPSCQRHINRPSINLVFRGIMCPNSSSTDSFVSPSSPETDKSFQMKIVSQCVRRRIIRLNSANLSSKSFVLPCC